MATTYDEWVESQKLPVHKGHLIEDMRTTELGWWDERKCNAAFVQLVGDEDIAEIRVIEIPPGKSIAPWKFGLDEIYYVLEGRGLATIWGLPGMERKTCEWQERSLFVAPRQSFRQLSNARGDKPARLMSYNYLPLAMQAVRDPNFFFNNPYETAPSAGKESEDFYSEAKAVWTESEEGRPSGRGNYYTWYGNFFPDMGAWSKLDPLRNRGAGGHRVYVEVPNSSLSAHMSVFPAQTYKKAHRHGPGRFLVIPAGEGYSVLWEEGKKKIVVPWHEASAFVPPMHWYHQHFNVGSTPARYLALHPPRIFTGGYSTMTDPARQIEYPDEDPWIRQTFEKELGKRDLTSIMPEEAYKDRNYEWPYGEPEGD
ncbi:MAG: cupin domain-containing protein [Chloroflexi bacterium]|nr:cupin domain-containing protein [Chloroflexota bacterium]